MIDVVLEASHTQRCLIGWTRSAVCKRLYGYRLWSEEGRREEFNIDILVCQGDGFIIFAGRRVIPAYNVSVDSSTDDRVEANRK